MNVAVINIKDLFKYILKFLLITVIAIISIKQIKGIGKIREKEKIKKEIENKRNQIIEYKFLNCLDLTMPIISYNNKNDHKEKIFTNYKILAMTSSIFNEDIFVENNDKIETKSNEEIKEKTYELPEKVVTEEVSENNIKPKYTTQYGSVKINNQSDYKLTEDMLVPDEEITNKNDILIYHTHTCESYTASEGFEYEMTGNYRTTDLNYSVARVGTELTKYLEKRGFNVEHNVTYHDYPSYSGSYSRAQETVEGLLAGKKTELVIDLHRDAVGSSNTYAPTIKIDNEYAAQVMFVIGTDGGGLEHPDWQKNLKIAIKIQEKANEMYPGLFRPIILRNSRYNQHVAKGACIIEVGATGNTMEQCILSANCIANVYAEVFK